MRSTWPAMMLVAGLALGSALHAQQTLTEKDRADIQALTAGYAKALGGCAAEEYADLFAPETGSFSSNIRGEVVGRDRLIALVRSERQCTNPPPANSATPAAPRPAPMVAISVTASGVTGIADLGNAGRYEDEYVKTPKGWRFKSRTVMTPPEIKAGLTAQDTKAIRRLAGTDLGQFDDVYIAGADGVKRFRASGVALGLSDEGVTGRAYLRSGGHYEDVYVRTPEGAWRFKSRAYVADAPTPTGGAGAPASAGAAR